MRCLFFVLCLFFGFTVSGQVKENLTKKLSPELQKLISTRTNNDSIDVTVSVKAGLNGKWQVHLLYAPARNVYVIRLPLSQLNLFVQNENVLFVNKVHPPQEEINTGASDPTLNLIQFSQYAFPQVRGQSVHTSVKERMFDTADIDLKGRVFLTGTESKEITSHASLMATIMAGAANSSPFAQGAAPGAKLSSGSFSNLFPETDSVYRKYAITMQNHSYGTIVENFYGNEAVAYDQNSRNLPQLLHVFSAGNAGTTTNSTGPYAGVANMATLSGNFKQAKNIITVSAVDSAGRLLPGSSRGPAYDGRVKPELVAYGEDGSSGAAALTSGAAILVQDFYQQKKAVHPGSELAKAILLNSADDAGATGIDYFTGYGLLNAYKALTTVAEDRYIEETIAAGETKSFSLLVPANTARLKITLAWNDVPATPNATKALVNDLDLMLRSESGEIWQPWVLNPTPFNLQDPPQRKRDTLNNAEQVSVDNPPAGTYSIEIKGTKLTTQGQRFAIAYQVDTAATFYWTFPTASDHLLSNKRQYLRWRTNISGSAKIEYATTGDNWREIKMIDSVEKQYLQWQVPDTVTNARLRLTVDNTIFLSDSFTINPQLSVQTGFNCKDSFLLYWNELPVQTYRLYNLRDRYLEPVATITDTAILLQALQQTTPFYSIAPLLNGKEGLRSNTSDYTAQGVGCYLRSFYMQTQTVKTALFRAELGTIYQVSEISLENLQGTAFTTVQVINNPQNTVSDFNDIPLRPGENRFRLKIKLANGTVIYSNTETVFTVGETSPVVVYPNPVLQAGILKIIVNEVGRYTLRMHDLAGKQVFGQELNSTVTSLSVAAFAKGMYLLSVYEKDSRIATYKQVIY